MAQPRPWVLGNTSSVLLHVRSTSQALPVPSAHICPQSTAYNTFAFAQLRPSPVPRMLQHQASRSSPAPRRVLPQRVCCRGPTEEVDQPSPRVQGIHQPLVILRLLVRLWSHFGSNSHRKAWKCTSQQRWEKRRDRIRFSLVLTTGLSHVKKA